MALFRANVRVGTALDAKQPVSALGRIAKSGKPVLIILGNEEDGISDVEK